MKDTKYKTMKKRRKSEDYRMEVKLYFLVLILHCNNNSMCKIHSPKMLLVHQKNKIEFQKCFFFIYCFLYLLALNLLCFIFNSLLLLFDSSIYGYFSSNYHYYNNFMGIIKEKNLWANMQNWYKKISKGIKSDNFFDCKVGRAVIIAILQK